MTGVADSSAGTDPAIRDTIESALIAAGNRPAGFDYMRLILSLAVVAMHAVPTAWGEAGNAAFWRSEVAWPFRMVLPMFFALSGFLVAGSLLRTKTLGKFLGLRAIRIFPALAVEVFLSALLLGTIFTVLPLREYFTDPLFARYFLNALGEPQYLLPGVFLDNPQPELVNAQLWTIPFELMCYIAIFGIGLVGLKRRLWLIWPATLALALVYFAWRAWSGLPLFPAIERPVSGPLLVLAFLLGNAFYFYRERIPMSHGMGIASLLVSVPMLAHPATSVLSLLPITYATVWLGTLDPPRNLFVRGADYSYGIFLYGYPIQQMLAETTPLAHMVWFNFLAAAAIAWGFAALSWNLVEKPALGWRKYLSRWEEKWLERKGRVQA